MEPCRRYITLSLLPSMAWLSRELRLLRLTLPNWLGVVMIAGGAVLVAYRA